MHVSLTPRRGRRYNHRACARRAGPQEGRNHREAHLSAEQPEACEDARLSQAHVDEGRPGDSRRAPPQGPQGPGAERSVVARRRHRGGAVNTITKASEIDMLFKEGRRVSHPALLVLLRPTPEGRMPDGRVVFVAGKRLGPAVVRNRCKRVLREAMRRTGGELPGWDVALVARERTASATPDALDRALRDARRSVEALR